MALLLLVLLLVLLRFATGAGASAEPPRFPATALFVLGDSTVGCAATASSILPLNLTTTATLPSSLSGGPCLFFPAARRRLPDLLAARMGLPSPPPISALNGTASEAARGVNFGGGGQLLFYGSGERGSSPSSVFRMGAVGQQVRLASETPQLLQLEAAAPGEWESATVFVLSFGADAYARLLARGPAEADAAAPKHGRRGFARLLADRVSRAVSVRTVVSFAAALSTRFDARHAARPGRRRVRAGAVRGRRAEGGGDGGAAAGVRAACHVGADPRPRRRLRGGGERADRSVQRQARGEAGRPAVAAGRRRRCVLRRVQGDDGDHLQSQHVWIRGDEGGVLRAGPLEGDSGVRQQGDGVRHAGAPRVVGPLQPHGGRRRQLVLDIVVGLRRHEHLRPHLSAAAGD